MNSQQVQTVAVQTFKAQLQLGFKGNNVVAGRNFALQQTPGIGCPGQGPTQLPFGGAVMPSCLYMVKTLSDSPIQRGLQLCLRRV